ncbi:hypothetical protein BDW71DRAFT_207525 [Aspergillus fruticulosus]
MSGTRALSPHTNKEDAYDFFPRPEEMKCTDDSCAFCRSRSKLGHIPTADMSTTILISAVDRGADGDDWEEISSDQAELEDVGSEKGELTNKSSADDPNPPEVVIPRSWHAENKSTEKGQADSGYRAASSGSSAPPSADELSKATDGKSEGLDTAGVTLAGAIAALGWRYKSRQVK